MSDRPEVNIQHQTAFEDDGQLEATEQSVGADDDWQAADFEQVHLLIYRGTTTLCTWTETRYDRGIAMASHQNDTDHHVVTRSIEAGDGFKVVHERRGPGEDTWTTVDDHQITA